MCSKSKNKKMRCPIKQKLRELLMSTPALKEKLNRVLERKNY